MGYSENIRPPYTIRERLDAVMPVLSMHLEIVPGISLSEWSYACGNAVENTHNVPADYLAGLAGSVKALQISLRNVAERLLASPNQRIPLPLEQSIEYEILQCAAFSEMLRPTMGESWPQSPAIGTGSEKKLVQQMIEQVRAEVKAYYASFTARPVPSFRG